MKLSLPIFRLKRLAKEISRSDGIPRHQALDRVAVSEGFKSWSHLSAKHNSEPQSQRLFKTLAPGDMMMLAARPGHGKTLLALELLAQADKAGRSAYFFTLDYNRKAAETALVSCGAMNVVLDTSDDICAEHIIARLSETTTGTIAVIDYLQLLDQKRAHPPLSKQVQAFRGFATRSGASLIFITQVDRRFDISSRALPELDDLRLPNPVDIGMFDSCCFLHEGKAQLSSVGYV